MNHHRYDYVAPETLEQVAGAMANTSRHTIVIGGGTMVVPQLTFRTLTPDLAVDLSGVAALRGIEPLSGSETGSNSEGAGLRLGALVTYSDVLSLVGQQAADLDLFVQLASGVTGGPQIRNQGTLCGSVAFANPSSDVPTAMVQADAVIRLYGIAGERTVAAADFFVGPFQTARELTEIVRGVDIPSAPTGASWGYVKVKPAESSWPICTAAACVVIDESGVAQECSVTLGAGIGAPRKLVLSPHLAQRGVSERQVAQIEEFVADSAHTWFDDELSNARYRRRIAPAVMLRAIEKAIERNRSVVRAG